MAINLIQLNIRMLRGEIMKAHLQKPNSHYLSVSRSVRRFCRAFTFPFISDLSSFWLSSVFLRTFSEFWSLRRKCSCLWGFEKVHTHHIIHISKVRPKWNFCHYAVSNLYDSFSQSPRRKKSHTGLEHFWVNYSLNVLAPLLQFFHGSLHLDHLLFQL